MNLAAEWTSAPPVTAMGWTLVHSLWQDVLIALALFVVLAFTRRSTVRYSAACSALVLMLIAFFATFSQYASGEHPVLPVAELTAGTSSVAEFLRLMSPWLVPLWMVGMLIMSAYHFGGWLGAWRLRRTGLCVPSQWGMALRRLAQSMRVTTPVLLLQSSRIDVPVVVGLLRPSILVPAGFLTALPPEQVEAILLHELAHVRRWDYLVNLIQALVENLLFYHPAAWWVSSAIRKEREDCCDDAVVAVVGDRRAYARALVSLEERRTVWRPLVAANSGGNLLWRVRRLLAGPEEPRNAAAGFFALLLLVCLVSVAATTYRSATAVAAGTIEQAETTRRVQFADQRFRSAVAGSKTDRGRYYIKFGPPDEIESRLGLQAWRYHYIEGIGELIVEFEDPHSSGDFHFKRASQGKPENR